MSLDLLKSKVVQEDILSIINENLPFHELKEKRVLISGATGLIGTYTVLALRELNRQKDLSIEIKVLTRDSEKAKKHFSGVSDDIEFYESIEDIEPNIDYILDFSSPTSSRYFTEKPVETMEANIINLWFLLELALESRSKKVIFSSSLKVYGNQNTQEPFKEESELPANPARIRDSYPISKIASEMLGNSYAHEYGIDFSSIRYAGTFGPSSNIKTNERFINDFIRKAYSGEDIVLKTEGKTKKQLLYLSDAITALFYVLFFSEKGESYNAADMASLMSIKETAEMIIKVSKSNSKVLVSKENTDYFPKEHITEMDTSKLRGLGWSVKVSPREMFSRIMGFLEEYK